MVKQRRDSITQYTEGNRSDLAEAEAAEIEIIEAYLPEPLSAEEIDTMIDEAIVTCKVMGAVKARADGRADMGTVGARVKARLNP